MTNINKKKSKKLSNIIFEFSVTILIIIGCSYFFISLIKPQGNSDSYPDFLNIKPTSNPI